MLIWNLDTYGIKTYGVGHKKPDSANWYVSQHRYSANLNQCFTTTKTWIGRYPSGDNYHFLFRLWNPETKKRSSYNMDKIPCCIVDSGKVE